MNKKLAKQIQKNVLSPISREVACGEDISFSADFEILKAEVDKADGLHVDAPPDWKKVIEKALDLLKAQSKDLWVLSYLIRGLWEIHGIGGLVLGLQVLDELQRTYWQDIFPPFKKIKRRAAALEWLTVRMQMFLSRCPNDSASIEQAESARLSLTSIGEFWDDRMGDKAPMVSGLLRSLPQERKEEPSDGAKDSAVSPTLSTTPQDILASLFRDTQDKLRQLAALYLAEDSLDWRGYLLNRTALWCMIKQVPAETNKVTQLRPVPANKRQEYQAAVANKKWERVLPGLEKSAAQAPFWLDGQYMISQCLEGLGAVEALEVQHMMLKFFLKMFPDIPYFKFFDQTPFASEETRGWIKEILATKEHLPEELVVAPLPAEEEGLSAPTNVPEDGDAFFIAPPAKNKEAVVTRVEQARIFLQAGNKGKAFFLLREIYQRLCQWDMLEWDPKLSLQVLTLLLACRGGEQVAISDRFAAEITGCMYWLSGGCAKNKHRGETQ